MPRPTAAAQDAFRSLLPKDAAVTARPMFGNLAAFVNGNMFTGLFGDDLFVRTSEDDRERLLKKGGADFAPMPGRTMKGYVTLPPGWAKRADATRAEVARSLDLARALPPKTPKPARAKRGA